MTIGRLARAAAIVALFGLLSRLLGFVREIVLAAAYGTSAVTDAFVNALMIVNAVAALLLYSLVTLIVPAFQRERAERGEGSAWRLVSAMAFWVGAFLAVMASLMALWPEGPAWLFQLDTERADQTAHLIRIMAPAVALQGFSALFAAMLQIHGRFAGSAAVGVAFNAGIIIGIAAFHSRLGIDAAAWGVGLGAVLQVVFQLPQFWGLLRGSGVRPAMSHPGLRRIAILAVPVLTASALQQINNFTDKLFASTLEAGQVAALNFASALGQAPRAALLLPLLTPLFPLVARLMSEGREGDVIETFRRAAGLLTLLAVPLMVIVAVNSHELTQLAFGRNRCGAECVDDIAPPLVFYALTIWPSFVNLLAVRTLAAADRQLDVLWITAISVAVTIGLDAALIGPMGIAGLALASAIALNLDSVILTQVVRRRFPSLSVRALLSRQARVLAAGLPALGLALALYWLWPSREMGSLELVPVVVVKVLAVLAVFLAAARLLCRTELSEGVRALRALVAGRVGRG